MRRNRIWRGLVKVKVPPSQRNRACPRISTPDSSKRIRILSGLLNFVIRWPL